MSVDTRHSHRGGGRVVRDAVGQGLAPSLVSDEDCRLLQRQREELHHFLEGRAGFQRHHP